MRLMISFHSMIFRVNAQMVLVRLDRLTDISWLEMFIMMPFLLLKI